MNARDYALLIDLLKQPTAPFREEHVITTATRLLERARVPYFRDPDGNIVVGCGSLADHRRRLRERSDEPLRVFIAHMDHPGFHGVRWLAPTRLRIKWHGGSPGRRLAGSRVWLATRDGVWAQGRLGRVRLLKSRHAIDTADVHFTVSPETPRPEAGALYGGFMFRAPVWRAGKKLYTKAADDLVGVFAILRTAMNLYGSDRLRKAPPFIGLLTRAEEVGFIGAIAHLDRGWLSDARRPVLCISLETSRTLPGAIVGKGPVVRLGDRRTVFHPDYLKLLADVAQKSLPKRHQRRIMDGGACEASAATAYGLPAIGVSVPLGNYHNEGFEGGPDCRAARGPAPEFVHLDDIDGMLKLCRALMEPGLAWKEPWKSQRELMRRRLKKYRALL
jgi:putative aminopeptidase FrvX